jgi:arylsulfatase
MTFEQGVRSIPESALPRTAGQSWSMTADLTLAQGAQGVVAAVGGGAGGWSVYLRPDGIPALTYRLFNLATAQLAGTAPLSPGQHRLRFDFDNYGGYGKPATIHLFVDDQPAGSQDLPASPIGAFALDDGFSVGVDTGSPVGDYPAGTSHGFPFTDGQVNRVTITRH